MTALQQQYTIRLTQSPTSHATVREPIFGLGIIIPKMHRTPKKTKYIRTAII